MLTRASLTRPEDGEEGSRDVEFNSATPEEELTDRVRFFNVQVIGVCCIESNGRTGIVLG